MSARSETIMGTAAALAFGMGIYSGLNAAESNNDVVAAEATAQTLEVLGDPRAAGFREVADEERENRDLEVFTTVTSLGATASMTGLVIMFRTGRRREDQKNEDNPQPAA